MEMHAGQVNVTPSIVHALIEDQFPQWRSLPIKQIGSSGTANAVFRLGELLVLRFPLLGDDTVRVAKQLELESAAAAKLLGHIKVPTPQPIAIGEAGRSYRLPWSVYTWVPGTVAIQRDPADSHTFARELAEFIHDVRAIPTDGRTFAGTGRGGVLSSHQDWLETCFAHSAGLLDVPRLRGMWAWMNQLPRGTEPDVMSHCDLMPGNVLVSDERGLAGVLDVGGLGPADPALDLVGAWHLLDDGPRQTFRDVLQPDSAQWRRGQAWAFQQAMGLVWYYAETNPAMSAIGRRTLARLLADEGDR